MKVSNEAFDPDSRWSGTVEKPINLRLCQIGARLLLERHRDELDLERVLLFELVMP